ncbi:MAG: 2-amino-4-hydroxy-6-hydroxymethyldihydropteridine diphosphokinase [Cognaticolwellia sp.]
MPHYGLKQREFVLLPLAEITPDLILPDGNNIQELADQINKNGLKIHSKLS